MIDDHLHPFPLTFTPFDPATISLDVSDDPDGHTRRGRLAPGRLSVELLTGRLAQLLDCYHEDVAATRDAVARADWHAYVRRLFDDAEITSMLLDEAVSSDQSKPMATYADLAGRAMYEITRVDPVIDRHIAAGSSANELVQAIEDHMAAAAKRGCVAFKTILAYRTGLSVDPTVDLTTAQRSLESTVPVRRRGKALRDLVLRVVLARAADLDLPVQIHTGIGDSELRLTEANPLLLEELLRSPEGRTAHIVLLHGAYPWHEQAAYLAATRPNVWIEFSLSNIFAPLLTTNRLLKLLDLAPRERLLTGSDGHDTPETHWFGCRTLLDTWQSVATHLSQSGIRDQWITDTREAMFEANAHALYKLP